MCPARYDLAFSQCNCCCSSKVPCCNYTTDTLGLKLLPNCQGTTFEIPPNQDWNLMALGTNSLTILFAFRWPSSIVADTFNSSAPSSPGLIISQECLRKANANELFQQTPHLIGWPFSFLLRGETSRTKQTNSNQMTLRGIEPRFTA